MPSPGKCREASDLLEESMIIIWHLEQNWDGMFKTQMERNIYFFKKIKIK
jgi:hypothetical protein